MTKKEIGEILAIINLNYGRRPSPEEAKNTARLWFAKFGNLDVDVLRAAIWSHINDKRVGMYYPNISHINAKLERASLGIDYKALSAPRTAELTAGRYTGHCVTPENRKALEWLESVFDNQGAGFYQDTDTPYKPTEEAKQ